MGDWGEDGTNKLVEERTDDRYIRSDFHIKYVKGLRRKNGKFGHIFVFFDLKGRITTVYITTVYAYKIVGFVSRLVKDSGRVSKSCFPLTQYHFLKYSPGECPGVSVPPSTPSSPESRLTPSHPTPQSSSRAPEIRTMHNSKPFVSITQICLFIKV